MRGSAIEEIVSCASLPTLPTVALELLELTRNPDVELSDIARVVESDPGLASRILKTVNSSLYGLREPCASIQRALAYLGLNAVKSLALGFSLVDMTRFQCGLESFDLVSYWRHSIYGAVAARHFATTCGRCDPDEAFTCGMFQDMGMFAAYVALGETYSRLLVDASGDIDRLMLLEQEQLGFNHLDAGAALCERWQFPRVLIDCIRHINDPDAAPDDSVRDMARIVALGRMMAETLNVPDPHAHLARIEALAAEWYDGSTFDAADALETVSTAAIDLADVLDQDIGEEPDINAIRRRAEEQSVELQLAVQREIEDLRSQRSKLASAALTDALTGIGNRAKFDKELSTIHQRAVASSDPYAVIFIDVDHFKKLNDTHGHQTGDDVLRSIAQRIRTTVGGLGEVFRYGGEEFVVMIADWDAIRAERFGELIRLSIAGTAFEASSERGEPKSIDVTASLGIAAFDPINNADLSFDSILRWADEALYEAKRSGRNRVCRSPQCTSSESSRVQSGDPPVLESIVHRGSATRNINEHAPASEAPSLAYVYLAEPDPLASTLLRAVFAGRKDVVARYFDNVDSVFAALTNSMNDEPSMTSRMIIIIDVTNMITTGFGPLTRLRSAIEGTSTRIITYSITFNDSIRDSILKMGAHDAHAKSEVARNLSTWIADLLREPTAHNQSAA